MTYTPRALSVSQVDLYVRCPALWHRRYVQRIHDPATGAMLFGTVMAKALEALHRGQDGEMAFIREYAAQITGQGVTDAPSLGHGLALLGEYRKLGVVTGEPEQKFELYLPNRDAVPVPIVGYLDVMTADSIVEFKTTSTNGWDQARADNSLQAHVYRWAFTQLCGRKPKHVRFIIMHTRRVNVTELFTYPSGGDLYAFELQAAAVWRGIRDGQFEPKCKRCPACEAAGFRPTARVGASWDMPD